MSETLKFAPSILARLGEELVSHPDQAIVELVKNAYDADARVCRVTLSDVTQSGGSIVIADDGDGMSMPQIRNGWLVLGRSIKDSDQLTRLGRLPVGEKGLGRLAALRLGQSVVLATRPAGEPGTEYLLEIDWSRFDEVDVVEDVELSIRSRPTEGPNGTSITIRDLAAVFRQNDTKRLARSLILLADPFKHEQSFRAELVSDEFREMEERVRNSYFAEATYRLCASLGSDGIATAEVIDHLGYPKWKADHEALRRDADPYLGPPAKFEIWEFTLNAEAFAHRSATVGEVKGWLGEVGGVHLYHRGLRVRPYGDRGHDWLEMNLRRARSPEGRPSTNNSIGWITVDDVAGLLMEKTDRSGFVENRAFSELRDFAGDALDWMARERIGERDRNRQAQRKKGPRESDNARRGVKDALARLPDRDRGQVEKAIDLLNRAQDDEREAILTDLQLYRTLSTVGTTASVFAHEAASPLTRIERLADVIEGRARKAIGDVYSDKLEEPVDLLRRAAQALRSFVRLPLGLLGREKRRVGIIDVHRTVDEVLELFEPFLTDSGITVKAEYVGVSPRVRGRVASLEAILANLLTNAIIAFQNSGTIGIDREVVIQIEGSTENVVLSVMDNGPGIRGISREDIWLPGQTTTPEGTGIGLTIVRDEANDLGGRAYLAPDSGEPGSEFVIELPMYRAT